jgi:3-hydroxy acid dehydrogenase / malonic semialdehyde reductase
MSSVSRTVLVTGASSGIGRAIAENLLQQGHFVIGCARDCRCFTTSHPNFQSIEMDFRQLNQLAEKAKQVLKKQPDLDSVIFAAGFGQFGSLEEFSYAQIETLMTVNFTSVAFLTRALLPALKQKSHADLIFIGSEAALKGSRKGSIYCASKFALRGFTQALREECATSGVRVGLINPGMVKSEFFSELNFAPGTQRCQHLLPEDVAQAVSYILHANPQIVIDEINLNPLHKVVSFKK